MKHRNQSAAKLLLLLGCSVICGCMAGPRRVPDLDDFLNKLTTFVSVVSDSTGTVSARVTVEVPLRSLVFFQENEVITGGVSVAVKATQNGQQIGGGFARETLQIPDWNDGQADTLLVCQVPLILRDSGELDLEVDIRGLGGSRKWKRFLKFDTALLEDLPLAFERFDWNLTRAAEMYGDLDSLICDVKIIKPVTRADYSDILLGVEITSFSNEQIWNRECSLDSLRLSGDQLCGQFIFPASLLSFGRLKLVPYVRTANSLKTRKRPWLPAREFANLHLDWSNDQSWQQHLIWLEGKTTPEILEEMREKTPEDRSLAWSLAWKDSALAGHKSNSALLETAHLRLIIEADQQYTHSEAGCLTARGKTWIRYGRPDDIRQFGDDMSRDSRWEVWTYTEDQLAITFYDAHGLGDFRLFKTKSSGE